MYIYIYMIFIDASGAAPQPGGGRSALRRAGAARGAAAARRGLLCIDR